VALAEGFEEDHAGGDADVEGFYGPVVGRETTKSQRFGLVRGGRFLRRP